MAKQLRQFFPYFGAKKRNARKYPAPTHGKIIEPFAGSAGYSHEYYRHSVELYDTNPAVCAAWEYIIGATEKDVLGLPLLSSGQTLDDFNLSFEERCFIGFWLVRASATPRVRFTSWAEKYPTRFWGEHIRKTVASQVSAVDHWKIHNVSFQEAPAEIATWFIDPPYVEAGGFYPHHNINYVELADWCVSRPGQVIVCESAGADWLPFEPFYEHVGIQRKKRQEVVWLS